MQYPRRLNRDGSTDAICPHCYVTIGSSLCEAELERIEGAHVCDPVRLDYFTQQRDKTAKKPQSEKPPQRAKAAQRLG